jgi:uncharacterized protein GlcG (DUF336 family)/uncharacterized membrane protein YtjA (UPF0391 family)
LVVYKTQTGENIMRKSYIIGHPLCVALIAGVLGLGTALADKGGTPNANANGDANGNASDDSEGNNSCVGLPGYSALKAALVAATETETSGLNNQMWGTIVDRDGVVCAVAFTGVNRGAQWPGSRVISAQKANTANAFSLDSSSNSDGSGQANGLALSTANLYSAVQPGGSLFGLQLSNPVDTSVAYKGPSIHYGTDNDPMVGRKIGGVNVFGGGLGLYATGKTLIGGVGVSGDTSCSDHYIAWRVRNLLGLDHLMGVGGVSGDAAHPDNIIFDITDNPNGGTGISAGGFGHPHCTAGKGVLGNGDTPTTPLPAVQP